MFRHTTQNGNIIIGIMFTYVVRCIIYEVQYTKSEVRLRGPITKYDIRSIIYEGGTKYKP
jgi:hypothetical protein